MADEHKRFIIDTIYKRQGLTNYNRDLRRARIASNELGVTLSKNARLLEQSTSHSFNKQGKAVAKTTAILQDHGKKVRVVYKKMEGQVTGVTSAFTKANTGFAKAGSELRKLVSRAGLVIPVWLALRGAVMGVLSTIKDLIGEFLALEKGMRRVMAVSRATGETQAKIYKDLETEARQYFSTTSRGFKDITEAMYQLGTAGRSTEEILKGFSHILDLATGTFGDVATAGKVVSGILNVFEKDLASVGDTEDQIRRVTDLLAFAWQNNQIELSEMGVAMGYLADVSNLLNLSIEEVITAQSVMNNRMLRGGKGARSLAQALRKVAQDSSKLRGLGVVFDETKPLNFRDIMQQLHDIYGSQKGDLSALRELIDVFGARGVRAVAALINNWDQFNDRIDTSTENIRGLSKELKETAEQTWPELIKKMWRQLIISRDLAGDISPLKQAMIDITSEADAGTAAVNELRNSWAQVKDRIQLSEGEALLLAQTLSKLKAPKLGKEIAEQFKVAQKDIDALELTPISFLLPSVQQAGVDILLNVLSMSQNLTREIKDQTDELGDQEPIIIKLTAGEKEKYDIAIALNKAKASEQYTVAQLLELEKQLVQQAKFSLGDHQKLVKIKTIENKLIIEGIKEQIKNKDLTSKIMDVALKGELDLLKLQGATELQIIKTQIALEEKLGIEKKGIEYLEQQFKLQQAITKEEQKTPTERLDALQKAIALKKKEQRQPSALDISFRESQLRSQASWAGISTKEIEAILEPTKGLKADLPSSLQNLTNETGVLGISMFSLQGAIESLTQAIMVQELAPEKLAGQAGLLTPQLYPTEVAKELQKIPPAVPAVTGVPRNEVHITIGDTTVVVPEGAVMDIEKIEGYINNVLDQDNDLRKAKIADQTAKAMLTPGDPLYDAFSTRFNSE